MEKKNMRLAAMGLLTMGASLLLMNLGRLEGVAPDWAIRVIGVVTMLCTGLSIFFTVRELAKHSSKNTENSKQTEDKE